MRKNKVICLPVAGNSNPYQKLMMDGLRNEGYNIRHGVSGKFFVFFRSVLKFKPSYIHVDWLHSYYLRREHWMTWLLFPLFMLDLLLTKYLFRIKYVWTLHNIFPHDRPVFGPYLWARIYFAKMCDWIRVFDESTVHRASSGLKVEPNKFKVVPEGDYISYYENSISKEEARLSLGLEKNKRVLLYLGLIKPYKGVLELVRSFEESPLKNQAILIIAGKIMNSNYGQSVKEAIVSDNVILHDRFIQDDELQIFFNAADAAVLPFERIENSGSAILAMGFAKPILAPHKGVLARRLRNQREFLYDTPSITSESITNLIKQSDDVLIQIGKLNYNELKKYKWEDFAKCF